MNITYCVGFSQGCTVMFQEYLERGVKETGDTRLTAGYEWHFTCDWQPTAWAQQEWQVFIFFLNRFLFLTRQSKWKGVLLVRNPCVANQYFILTSCLYLYTMLYDMLYHILYRTVITYVTQQVKQKIIQWYLALVWYYITYIIQCML